MEPFWISEISEVEGRRTIYVNPNSAKYCTFDCVFCELGRSKLIEQPVEMMGTSQLLLALGERLREDQPDYVMLYPAGEGLFNNRLSEVITLIKEQGSQVGLLSNGYIFNRPEYQSILGKCDEVVGELMVTREADFQRLLRPLPGFTLAQHVANLKAFRLNYSGRLILSLHLLKGYSDHPEALEKMRQFITQIQPDQIEVTTPDAGPMSIAATRLAEIRYLLGK